MFNPSAWSVLCATIAEVSEQMRYVFPMTIIKLHVIMIRLVARREHVGVGARDERGRPHRADHRALHLEHHQGLCRTQEGNLLRQIQQVSYKDF